MRICVLTEMPCIFNGGYSQRVLREMALLESNSNYKVYYYTFFSLSIFKRMKKNSGLSGENSIKSATEKTLKTHKIKDIEAQFLITSRIKCVLTEGFYDQYYANKVIKYIQKHQIDVLLCENLWCAYIGSIVSRKIDVKYVFDYHGIVPEEYRFFNNEKEDWNYFYFKRIEKEALINADHIICVSNQFKNYLVKEFDIKSLKIDVVPCCVSEVKWCSDKNKLKEQLGLQKRKVIIYAGSITKYQCLNEMAFLFSELIKKDSSFYFLFLSAYQDYDIFEKQMKKRNVSDDFYMLKSVPQKEVHNYLCMADYALIIREKHLLNQVASPTKIAEYLMAGLPIIGTNCIGDIEDIPSAKILFDFEELKSNINTVVDEILEFDKTFSGKEENIQVARAYVKNKLTWSAYKKLYTDVMSLLSGSS